MMRTSSGERLALGNKPAGQRIVGFPSIQSGAGKRQPSIPSVTGAPSSSVPLSNNALPGKPSRGLSTNFGARGIAPYRPGSAFGVKAAYQPLTMRRSLPFLETRAPSQEAPQLPGFVREQETFSDPRPAPGPGTMNKLAKVYTRVAGNPFKRASGGLNLDG